MVYVFHDTKAIKKITVADAVNCVSQNTGSWCWLLSSFSFSMRTSAHYVCLCELSSHLPSVHLNCTQRAKALKGVLEIMDQQFIDVGTEAWEEASWPRSCSSGWQSWGYDLVLILFCLMYIKTNMGNLSFSLKTQFQSPSSTKSFFSFSIIVYYKILNIVPYTVGPCCLQCHFWLCSKDTYLNPGYTALAV